MYINYCDQESHYVMQCNDNYVSSIVTRSLMQNWNAITRLTTVDNCHLALRESSNGNINEKKKKKGKIASFPRIIRTHFDFAAFAGSLPLSTSTSCRPLHLRRTSWKREWAKFQKRTRGCPISLKRWSFHFETLEFLLQAKFLNVYHFRMQGKLRIPFWWLIASPALVMYCPKRTFLWRRKWQLRSIRMLRNRPIKQLNLVLFQSSFIQSNISHSNPTFFAVL